MNRFSDKTVWLIGASEGLGRELAKQLDDAGAKLILSARNSQRLETLADELTNARVLALDVTDTDSVRRAAADIGDVDAIVYNAGNYEPMRATDWDTHSVLTMVDVNFTGVIRVLGEVIPRFLQNGDGDITLIGSLAGYRGLPGAVGYGASKAALISLAETLRFDLKDTGVVVRVINPGFIRTRLTEKNDFKMPMLMSPQKAATYVFNAMQKSRFRTDFPRPFSWVIRCLDVLPDWLVYRMR